ARDPGLPPGGAAGTRTSSLGGSVLPRAARGGRENAGTAPCRGRDRRVDGALHRAPADARAGRIPRERRPAARRDQHERDEAEPHRADATGRMLAALARVRGAASVGRTGGRPCLTRPQPFASFTTVRSSCGSPTAGTRAAHG